MAKEQGISLNPVKISGTCGRLMCCLKYEQNAYEHLLRVTPKNGAIVDTKEGRGVVIDANLLTGILKIRFISGRTRPGFHPSQGGSNCEGLRRSVCRRKRSRL